MTNTTLEYRLRRPDGAGDGSTVAVLLHGRGSNMDDLQSLAPALPADWIVVTPQAPNHGMAWGYGPGWAWYRYVAEDRMVEETLDSSLEALDAFLDALPELVGVRRGRIVLGGVSQGGTMSMAYALTKPGRVAAAWNFSGFLAASLELDIDPGDAPPLYWGHGLHDPAIPFALAERGRGRLAEAGIAVSTGDYPIGHWIVPEEIREALAVLPPS